MKFHRIYIEVTNECGLACSFCPSSVSVPQKLSLEFFESIILQAQKYTKEIACHVMGDPLRVANLSDYLDILQKYKMKALLTTSGYYFKKHSLQTLFHPAIKQINVSLNSYNKNDTSLTLEQYLTPIMTLCKAKADANLFINLRLWNLDEQSSEKNFNKKVFDFIGEYFLVDINIEKLYQNPPKTIRLASKVLLHFDTYFEWPSLDNPLYGHGTCQGLSSHIAILVDGSVVPCCLDSKGIIELGNLKEESLQNILQKSHTQTIIEGFKDGIATEELCQHCSYKNRFN